MKTTHLLFTSVMFLILVTYSCKKDKEFETPKTKVEVLLSIQLQSNNALTTNIEITNEIGAELTRRGICYSTNPAPTISDSLVESSSNSNSISIQVNNLIRNNIYYFRAFIESAAGEILYSETSKICMGLTYMQEKIEGVINDVDGNYYPYIDICGKKWTVSNLRTTKFSNGAEIYEYAGEQGFGNFSLPNIPKQRFRKTNEITSEFEPDYGYHYNCYSIVSDSNLCPTGWHVATATDWDELATCLGGQSIAGGKLKSTNSWASPNVGATNSSGFTALPASYIWGVDGVYNTSINSIAQFATSSSVVNNGVTYLQGRNLKSDSTSVISAQSLYNDALSVRCVKN